MLFKEFEHRCRISKSTSSLGPIENANESKDPNINDTDKNIQSWGGHDNYNNVDLFFGIKDIPNFISGDTFLVKDSNGDIYSIYFDIENHIFEIDNDHSFCSELESSFYQNSSYLNNGSKSKNPQHDPYMNDTQYTWNSYINSCIDSYLQSQICIDSYIVTGSDNSNRIELSIDPGTWEPMDKDMVSLDPIEFHSKEEPYENHIDSYKRKIGLIKAVQTGIGQLDGINVAIAVMDFQFMGGSMGSVVGEKITRLIEYTTKEFLPLVIVCASRGEHMQEGSLSLMQMAKISSALYDYQSNKKLFYVPILTSPTTGGVTTSFGMLGDIIIVEPNAYIAFAGKRVIEQTLNKIVPDGSQAAGYLFKKGLFDLIVPHRIELSIDPSTWEPMDEGMVSLDPIQFHSEDEPYNNRKIDYNKDYNIDIRVEN
ncbi:hypothetical protein L1987_38011 [Smallanthus sonchifolius]|uniref:Uncharacterized protein n=1 Tax=Smallanthus sonchifolius TaxID=185202 RepID=A0ACB9HHQ4_9ASTR|nr:hypothetical protein L1987_38011 [Smallanthus sonchifolius]